MSEADYSSTIGGEYIPDARTLMFRGTGGEECERFIRAVRLIALGEGKEDDDRWMLHFATARLSGKAMRWHTRLDKEIRKDWDLLVQAMLDEYPVHQEDEMPDAIIAAAPFNTAANASSQYPMITSDPLSPRPSILSPGLNVGRLRIVPESGHANVLYVSKDLAMTITRTDALHVQFLQSAEPHRIGMIGWNITEISCVRGYLLAISGLGICSSYSASKVKENLDCWRVASDGVVGMKNSAHEGERLLVSLYNQNLQFSRDPIQFIQKEKTQTSGTYYEARLVFEPLDFGE